MLLDDGGCGQLNKIIPEETDRKQDGPAATRGCFFLCAGCCSRKKRVVCDRNREVRRKYDKLKAACARKKTGAHGERSNKMKNRPVPDAWSHVFSQYFYICETMRKHRLFGLILINNSGNVKEKAGTHPFYRRPAKAAAARKPGHKKVIESCME